MYVRPQNYRYPSGVRLPQNYSGSTFGAGEQRDADVSEEKLQDEEKNDGTPKEALLSKGGFGLRLGSLFGDNKKIGTEELLIIALILLLADSDNNDDLILFLVLLFFIK